MEPQQKQEFETALAACIKLAVDMQGGFQLYAYRVIGPETFVNRVLTLVNETIKSLPTSEVDDPNANQDESGTAE